MKIYTFLPVTSDWNYYITKNLWDISPKNIYFYDLIFQAEKIFRGQVIISVVYHHKLFPPILYFPIFIWYKQETQYMQWSWLGRQKYGYLVAVSLTTSKVWQSILPMTWHEWTFTLVQVIEFKTIIISVHLTVSVKQI